MSEPGEVVEGRRRALQLAVTATLGLLTGGLAALLGGFVSNPRQAGRRERWVRAAALTDLEPGSPLSAILSVPRAEGWYRHRVQERVYLTADVDGGVRALSATCTHLGCLVHWEPDAKQFKCPCHGGVYDAAGRVVSGPPPRPLTTLQTKTQISAEGVTVLVRV